MTLNQEQTTRELAVKFPAMIPILESIGIDYCCGGTKTLADACKKAHVEWADLLQLLKAADVSSPTAQPDWTVQPLDTLTRHIIDAHHVYTRRATLRIHHLLEKIVAKHGDGHPELQDIRQLFEILSRELAAHMMKEENVLFPYIERIVVADRQKYAPPEAFFGSVEAPITQMLAEHDGAGELMAKIRILSGQYQPPTNACPTYHALYHGLAEFEQDLHLHVHLENNILFPGALKLETQALAI
jgi:regulator of cell morphogenesis and NO signaling